MRASVPGVRASQLASFANSSMLERHPGGRAGGVVVGECAAPSRAQSGILTIAVGPDQTCCRLRGELLRRATGEAWKHVLPRRGSLQVEEVNGTFDNSMCHHPP